VSFEVARPRRTRPENVLKTLLMIVGTRSDGCLAQFPGYFWGALFTSGEAIISK
jgi:hypothetical protein